MGQMYDSIKGLISQDMIVKAAETLGENEANVRSAVKTILPALLGRMLASGNTPHILGVVTDAGNDKLITALPEVFKGHGIVDGKNYGERMENALIGSQNSEFPAAIGTKRNMKVENADRLTNWVSSVVAGYFGDQIVSKKKSMVSLLQDLEKEKSDLAADIPNDLYAKLGISRVFGTSSSKTTVKKKGNGWMWWLIAILLLLILLFFFWRSCDRKDATAAERARMEQADRNRTDSERATQRAKADADKAAADAKANMRQTEREMVERTLPGGQKISLYKNSSSDQILEFLNSDRYKNASANDLKGMWFEFEDIDFKFDSANELTDGSMTHVNNLISIMKSHKDAKIEIGGYADEKGTRKVNMEISKQRAEYIKSLFVKGGIDANRISTEGFGKEFATVPANATNAQRAIDRNIAMRFVK